MKGLISTLYDTALSLCSPSDQTLLTLWSQGLNVDLADSWESYVYTHPLYVPDMGSFNASFYIVYIGQSPDCLIFIPTSTHCVTNVDRIVADLFICFGHVHP